MSEHALMAACFIFAGALLLMIVLAMGTYRIGYNNGYDMGYRDGRSDRRKERNIYKRHYADSVKVLPPRSERMAYIDGQSKYDIDLAKQNKNYR